MLRKPHKKHHEGLEVLFLRVFVVNKRFLRAEALTRYCQNIFTGFFSFGTIDAETLYLFPEF